jgi:tetratricopeptide (TPR) repeat protein
LIISTKVWRQLTPADFEKLALAHVRDVYPDYSWRSTSLTKDGGKDAVGKSRTIQEGLSEMYWMEAKHHPSSRSIGQYTLDTHLVSAFFSRSVKRLHVVTSGSLSDNFIYRAHLFSKEHGFVFAYSDDQAVECWLGARRDILRQYFGKHSDPLIARLEERYSNQAIFARGLIIADNDSISSSQLPALHLLPGKKFRLVVSLSTSAVFSEDCVPLQLEWNVPPERASLMVSPDAQSSNAISFNPSKTPIVSVPFRLLTFSREALPSPTVNSRNGKEVFSIPLAGTSEIPRLTSPFVGSVARQELLRLKRILRDEVGLGRPRLIACNGRAGSGKTRLAEELRDDAQLLGFAVRWVELSPNAPAQEDQWRQLFRWLFGLAQNPFDLPEDEIIRKRLAPLDIGQAGQTALEGPLTDFLTKGMYSLELFDIERPAGRQLADALREFLTHRFGERIFLHIDDGHHLSRRQFAPLLLLRHLVETSDSLSLCLVITARNDETVRDFSFAHFVSGLELGQFAGFDLIDLPDMSDDDAKELVATTLRWPELLSRESRTLNSIVRRAGTNPFFLMQTLDHLAVDHETIAFGAGETYFLINIPAFKKALYELPRGVKNILSERFAGLLRSGDGKLLEALAAMAVIGRHAPKRLVMRALKRPLSTHEIGRLLTLGYLNDASARSLILAHDLLVEALRERPEARKVASRLAATIRSGSMRNITAEQRAAIYYAAGPRFYRDSWTTTRRIVESRARRQEYLSLQPLFERLERIASISRDFVFDQKLSWLAAITEQHCGSTYAALQRFLKIRKNAEAVLPQNPERYVDALIEIGNQHLLRAEPSPALQNISLALEILNDASLRLSRNDRLGLETLAHNRYGAVLHLLEREAEALEQFNIAVSKGEGSDHNYLLSHCHWNIASLTRFSDPVCSQNHLAMARRIWNEKLRQRDRLRIMIECSEAYSECLTNNSYLSRARLRAIAAEASEKGYLFQACDTLLCYAACAMISEQWEEAQRMLLTALDLTVAAENLRSRIMVTHYMSVCSHMLGAEIDSDDWARQAADSLKDDGFRKTLLSRCLEHNKRIRRAPAKELHGPLLKRAGNLIWYQWERA